MPAKLRHCQPLGSAHSKTTHTWRRIPCWVEIARLLFYHPLSEVHCLHQHSRVTAVFWRAAKLGKTLKELIQFTYHNPGSNSSITMFSTL
jgi:hypothetical protein